MSDVYVWSDVEPCLGIICASLPAVQPLVRSVMKMENLLCLRQRLHMGKPPSGSRVSSSHRLQKRNSNSSNTGSHLTQADSFDGKGELGVQPDDDEAVLTTVVTHIEHEPRTRANLEELLGPGFIRVRHEIEISVV